MNYSLIDVTRQKRYGMYLLGMDDCEYFSNEGMGNQLIWDNSIITGTSDSIQTMIIPGKIYNITMTNNLFNARTTAIFSFEVVNEITPSDCQNVLKLDIFENNTIVNPDGLDPTYFGFVISYDFVPSINSFDITIRGNQFINQSYNSSSVILIP
jgi:hypothetical protein